MDVGMWLGHSAYLEIADGAIVDFRGRRPRGRRRPRLHRRRRDPHVEPPGPRRFDRRRRAGRSIEQATSDLTEAVAALRRARLAGPSDWQRPSPRQRSLERQIPDPCSRPGDRRRKRAWTSTSTSAAVTRTWARSSPGGSWRCWAAPAVHARKPAAAGSSWRARIVDPAVNPLTPRVLVNRLWKHHFGEGIVQSTDDFGAMGRKPSHPELLDWLAAELVESGWSIKAIHRLMVTSSTYRMSSVPIEAEPERLDPENHLPAPDERPAARGRGDPRRAPRRFRPAGRDDVRAEHS